MKQTIGTLEDSTELPEEYLQLETSVDNLKAVHNKLLSVTEISKTIQEKVQNLASVQSANEIQAAIMKPTTKGQPKTLNHALSRAALASCDLLDSPSPLKELLHAYAQAQDRIGSARLEQDQKIITRFNESLLSNLQTIFHYSTKARKNVNSSRISLDALKLSAKGSKPEKQEQMQSDIEHAEDVFVTAVEEATQIMKNTLETPELISQMKELIEAQCSFYKEAYEILSSLLNDSLKKYYH
ncbi:hypothetical protein PMAC_000703 [Pneumocystis sp. 'macacae']|nr:hypothetical protein PMAC_000703 [Pneumocystis sp. 'macacae']